MLCRTQNRRRRREPCRRLPKASHPRFGRRCPVLSVLRRIEASGSSYLLTTSYPRNNGRSNARWASAFRAGRGFSSFGAWNLQEAPFNLTAPLLAIGYDGWHFRARWHKMSESRIMGLWRLPLERSV